MKKVGLITGGMTMGGMTMGGLTMGGLTMGGLTMGGLTMDGLTMDSLTMDVEYSEFQAVRHWLHCQSHFDRDHMLLGDRVWMLSVFFHHP
ncbi:hypothetical protein [Candidatus Spongiihabitans sp.]|uniref:hypothetical protein n=1 Tax=Candidatus Spongiihabitans sp. TaxID=3101308 RepID=UPI003C6F67A2